MSWAEPLSLSGGKKETENPYHQSIFVNEILPTVGDNSQNQFLANSYGFSAVHGFSAGFTVGNHTS